MADVDAERERMADAVAEGMRREADRRAEAGLKGCGCMLAVPLIGTLLVAGGPVGWAVLVFVAAVLIGRRAVARRRAREGG